MSILKLVALGIATWQASLIVDHQVERQRMYKEAEAYAQSVGKPLLIIGGPYGSGGVFRYFKAHGCGDVCLDIEASACRGCPTVIGDIRDIPFPDQYFGAAFASHVIEHLPTVDDAVQAVNELYRVAEGIWIASPNRWAITGIFNPGHHLWVHQNDRGVFIEAR